MISRAYCTCQGLCGLTHGQFRHCEVDPTHFYEPKQMLVCKGCYDRLMAKSRASRSGKSDQLSLFK